MIVPLWNPGYFPDISEAEKTQRDFYKELKINLNKGIYVDVKNNTSYIYYYIDSTRELFAKNKDIKTCHKKLTGIFDNYKEDYPSVASYAYIQLSAIYFVIGNDEKCWEYHCESIKINSYSDDAGSKGSVSEYLNCVVKRKNQKMTYEEFTFIFGKRFKSYLTEFGYQNWDSIQPFLLNNLINIQKETNRNFIWYVIEKEEIVVKSHQRTVKNNRYNVKIEREVKVGINDLRPTILNKYLKNLIKKSENDYRFQNGFPKVGEGWISETVLYYHIKHIFKNTKVVNHFRDKNILGKQHLDIYMPELKIGIEYQGAQHSRAINFFGGEEAFQNSLIRDQIKKEKCDSAEIYLIYVEPNYLLDDIIFEIESYLKTIDFKYVIEESLIFEVISIKDELIARKKIPQNIRPIKTEAKIVSDKQLNRAKRSYEYSKTLLEELDNQSEEDKYFMVRGFVYEGLRYFKLINIVHNDFIDKINTHVIRDNHTAEEYEIILNKIQLIKSMAHAPSDILEVDNSK